MAAAVKKSAEEDKDKDKQNDDNDDNKDDVAQQYDHVEMMNVESNSPRYGGASNSADASLRARKSHNAIRNIVQEYEHFNPSNDKNGSP